MICSCRDYSKATVLGFEKRDVQPLVLLALVSVFEKMRMIYRRLADAVLPQSGQHYDIGREAVRAHTFLPSEMLLAGGEREAGTSLMGLLLDEDCLKDCRFTCRRRLLPRDCCFLMPWGRFPTNGQLRHVKYEPQTLHLDPLVSEVGS